MFIHYILIPYFIYVSTSALKNEEDSLIYYDELESSEGNSSQRQQRFGIMPPEKEVDLSVQMLNSIYFTKVMKVPSVEKGDDDFDRKVCTNLPWTKQPSESQTREPIKPSVVETTINSHPYMTQIMVDDQFRCSGTLITRKHVMSAAKCVVQFYSTIETLSVNRLFVRVGSTYLYRGGDVHNVSKVVTHPKYHWSTSILDISILTLSTCVKLSKKVNTAVIHPDCGMVKHILANVPSQAPGWGFRKETTYKSASVLHVDNEYLYDNGDCHNIYRYGKHRNYSYFPAFCVNACSGVQDDGLKLNSQCQGDIGGPLYYLQKYFIGVVVFRRGCLFPKYPTLSTVVCLDYAWINRETNDLHPNCDEESPTKNSTAAVEYVSKETPLSTTTGVPEPFYLPIIVLVIVVGFVAVVYHIVYVRHDIEH